MKTYALYVWNGSYRVFEGQSALNALAVVKRLDYRRAADGVYVKRGTFYRPALRPMAADLIRV